MCKLQKIFKHLKKKELARIGYEKSLMKNGSEHMQAWEAQQSQESTISANNDEILLGRVSKHDILNRSAYEFFSGIQLDGKTSWSVDSTIAQPIWSFPLMTSVQQVNFLPSLNTFCDPDPSTHSRKNKILGALLFKILF